MGMGWIQGEECGVLGCLDIPGGLYTMEGNRVTCSSRAFSVPQPLSTQGHKLDSAGTSRCQLSSLQCGEGPGTHPCERVVGTIGDGRSADIKQVVLGPGAEGAWQDI